ncbi:MAG: BrnT family toxin [Gemmatimonadota bacterium]|nr:BrnT family toxin [Gemmatimonadota bacterium]
MCSRCTCARPSCRCDRPCRSRKPQRTCWREARYAAVGQTAAGRRLFLVFTLRGSLIRVISARPMSRREREVYRRAEVDEGKEDDQADTGA